MLGWRGVMSLNVLIFDAYVLFYDPEVDVLPLDPSPQAADQ